MTISKPIAVVVTGALALVSLLAGALPAQAYSPAYDSKITGRIVGPDGKPAAGMDVIVHTDADKPYGQGDQDMSARTATDSSGRFNFRADSRTVYKVRFMDITGWEGRKPFTFSDKWFGGKNTFDDADGYASAKEIVFDAPGVKDLGVETAAFASLPAFTVSSKPAIHGDRAYGQELFATPGSWSPTPIYGWNYTWYRGEAEIGRGETYRVGVEDIGQSRIHVVVNAAQWAVARYTEARSADVSIPPVKLTDPGASFVGRPQVGQRLTVELSPPDGGDDTMLAVIRSPQWYRNGITISGAQSMDYDVVAADLGTVLSFKAGNLISHSPAQTPAITAGVFGSSPVPTISGTVRVGSTLTAVPGTWGPAPVELRYQWYRSGTAVIGATASTYKPVADDAGKTLTVTVSGLKGGYTIVARTSAATAAVALRTMTAPVPTITGTAEVGSTLTAVPGVWGPAPVTLAYQWYAGGTAIIGATANTYKPVARDVGKTTTVTVTGTKTGYTTTAKTSAATAAVAAPAPVPTISGTAKVGSTLTAVPGDWGPASVTLAYQWYASGTAIAGATTRTYKPVAGDAGKTLTVIVTATRVSASTALIG